jgi:hypothetical protein
MTNSQVTTERNLTHDSADRISCHRSRVLPVCLLSSLRAERTILVGIKGGHGIALMPTHHHAHTAAMWTPRSICAIHRAGAVRVETGNFSGVKRLEGAAVLA